MLTQWRSAHIVCIRTGAARESHESVRSRTGVPQFDPMRHWVPSTAAEESFVMQGLLAQEQKIFQDVETAGNFNEKIFHDRIKP